MAYYDNPLAPPNTGEMDKYLKKTEAAETYVPKSSETNQIQGSSSVLTMGGEMEFESNEFIFRTWDYGPVLTIGNGIAMYLGNELATKQDISNVKAFIAEYGNTPFSAIKLASAAGYAVFCVYYDGTNGYRTYPLTNITGSSAIFTAPFYTDSLSGVQFRETKCFAADNSWTHRTYYAEAQINKVTTLSVSSTNTQYPSAKCVYDALQNAVGDVHAALQELLGGETEAIV